MTFKSLGTSGRNLLRFRFKKKFYTYKLSFFRINTRSDKNQERIFIDFDVVVKWPPGKQKNGISNDRKRLPSKQNPVFEFNDFCFVYA